MQDSFAVDGTRVHAEVHEPDRARGGAVLLHGFNSCAAEMRPLGEALAAVGIRAVAFDQRGFGASGGERGRTDLGRVVTEAEAAATLTKRPTTIIGHSLGASMALGVLSRSSTFVAGVAAHPVRNLLEEMGTARRLGYHVLGRLNERRMRKGHASWQVPYPIKESDLFVSKARARAAARDPFLLRKANLGNYAFARTMDATDWAKRVRVPVLGITSPHDAVVDPMHSEAVLAAVADCERIVHEGGHSCFLDVDGHALCEDVAAWVKDQ